MSKAVPHRNDDQIGLADDEPLDWNVIEAGLSIAHPLRLRNPDAPTSAFVEDAWSLKPLDATRGTVQKLNWVQGYREQQFSIPSHLISSIKRIVWLNINRPTSESQLAGTNARRWPAAVSIADRFRAYRRFAHFLGQEGILRLCDASKDLLDTYATELLEATSDATRASRIRDLGYIGAIAYLAEDLPDCDKLTEPTWCGQQLGKRHGHSGNSKAVIHPDTFAPLLWWCQQIVRCAPDIVSAARWRSTARGRSNLAEGSPTGLDAVAEIVDAYEGVLPQGEIRGHVAAQYLVALHNGVFHRNDFRLWRILRQGVYSVNPDLPQPIPIPITCFIEGRLWIESIDYRDVEKLQRILQAAAAVLICACSGMRGEECRRLQRGALQTIPRPDNTYSYRIDGRIFKGARDDNDQQDRGGKKWLWATIKPAADAITALEQLADVGGTNMLLANLSVHEPTAVISTMMNRWIEELIMYANELAVDIEVDDTHHIATDPAGRVTLDRFRRSIAWHIVNQPDGLVAAGVQFGHMRSTTTDGYASTISSGFAATMDQERAHALYTTLQNHANATSTGINVSGPAANRLGIAINRFAAQQFPGTYADLSKRDERRLRADPDLVVRENPGHGCLCLANPLKPETMACSQEHDSEPNLNGCKTYCGNRAYTDETIAEDKNEVARLQARIEGINPIMAARLRKRITHLSEHIAEHEATKLPLKDVMATHQKNTDSAEELQPAPDPEIMQ
ncbi:phage integrase family protein [Mycobacteroides abscessus subsp. abscessus]|uniref:hypothetical protein n=1 Tax=Mycobacteroides abscessus TaxID=36809 RepID=UPI0009274104|nr:hypothetical protein [Mycobacteroides abscessus]SHU73594.1 phage integrase family protein [Mycobacteroides abscessus subsp. abscessus]